MKKWMIILIIIIYSVLIGLIIYYFFDNRSREDKLIKKAEILEIKLKEYYDTKYDNVDLGKIFLFPGETNIDFDDSGLSGSAFIYQNGTIEIALYDGKFCAYKKDALSITKSNMEDCVVNRTS